MRFGNHLSVCSHHLFFFSPLGVIFPFSLTLSFFFSLFFFCLGLLLSSACQDEDCFWMCVNSLASVLEIVISDMPFQDVNGSGVVCWRGGTAKVDSKVW